MSSLSCRLLVTLAAVALSAASVLAPGCSGGGGGDSSPAGGGVIYVRSAPIGQLNTPAGQPAFLPDSLVLETISVRLVAADGRRFAVAVASEARFTDLVALTTSATVLGYGTFPELSYTGLEVVLSSAELTGTPLGASTVIAPDPALPAQFTYSAPFPAPITLTAYNALLLQWGATAPVVSATSVVDQYDLNGEAAAFVIGSTQPGAPATVPVRYLVADLSSINCISGQASLNADEIFFLPTSTTGGTSYLDHTFVPTQVTCNDLTLNDMLLVNGTVGGSATIAASRMRVLHSARLGHGGGSHHGGAFREFRGVIRQIATVGNTGVDMRIFQGSLEIARVFTDNTVTSPNGGTVIQREDGTAFPFASLAVGQRVRVVASVVVQNGSSTPEAMETDLVLLEQP